MIVLSSLFSLLSLRNLSSHACKEGVDPSELLHGSGTSVLFCFGFSN